MLATNEVSASSQRPAAKIFPVLAGAALIAGMALVAYWPSLGGSFIWDDRLYLTHCELIQAPDGLYRFWFTTDPIDYWPFSNSSLWLEWRLWGMDPGGYRVTNLLLHIAVALLVWGVLHRLSVPGAFLAALLFAVHPVNVESVAWIAQRKGLMAMLFLMLSILLFLRHDTDQSLAEESDERGIASFGRWHWLSLLAFVLAMLSKGSVAFLPVVLLGILWWKRRRITAADAATTIPFFLVAIALTAVNIWFQGQHAGVGIRKASFPERLAGAGDVLWFYLSKALLPINLAFVYPLSHVRPDIWFWWLPLGAALAVTAILLRRRNGNWIRPICFGWMLFCLALVPVLGFTDVYFMKFSLVADHYQYHSLVAVVALVAAGWAVWRRAAHGVGRIAATVTALGIVGSLTVLTMQQSRIYHDAFNIWQTTLQRNPDSSVAHVNLGVMLASDNQLPESISHFLEALRIDPADAEAHHDLGTVYFKLGRTQDAIEHYQLALKYGPDSAETQSNLGLAFARTGQLPEAVGHFRRALQLNPALVDTRFALAQALSRIGSLEEAIAELTEGLKSRPDSVSAHFNLALIYAKLNRPADAQSAAQRAFEFAKQQGQAEAAQQIESWLNSYRGSQPPGSSEPAVSLPPSVPPSSKP